MEVGNNWCQLPSLDPSGKGCWFSLGETRVEERMMWVSCFSEGACLVDALPLEMLLTAELSWVEDKFIVGL
jgi:hypothetical protein